MPMYSVSYGSMTACYGPSYICANSEDEARRKFAGTAFSRGEMSLITAREVSEREITQALRNNK